MFAIEDKPPVKNAVKGSDGVWYVKHRGRWWPWSPALHLDEPQQRRSA